MGFLNIHENQENEPLGLGKQSSPERSPMGMLRPMIPPLDLSILHENVDGSGEWSTVCIVIITVEPLVKGRSVERTSPLFRRLFQKPFLHVSM